MEQYAKILIYVMPTFFAGIVIEKLYGYFAKRDNLKSMDVISSLSSGITNTIKDVLGLGITILSYQWLYDKVSIFHIESTVWAAVIAFIAIDFYGYYSHRFSHQINFFCNYYLIHHSSEEFDLACALRQSISNLINFFTILLLPAAILGVPPAIIGIVAPLHLFLQFWYHTVYIGKLGFLEKIIVTPSHHRVHHAINPIYIDKNHGQIFIIWDKLFGTFQEELPDVPPVFGITRPVHTWNPIKINFQHLWLMAQDAFRTNNWGDKLRIWIMPTGWRPADVVDKYPLEKIEDPYHFEKYYPKTSNLLEIWSWIQFFVVFGFINFLFLHITEISKSNILMYGAWLMLSVYAFTELMDRNPNAIFWEITKNIIGFALIYNQGSWFGASSVFTYLIASYLIVSSIVVLLFVVLDIRKDTSNLQHPFI